MLNSIGILSFVACGELVDGLKATNRRGQVPSDIPKSESRNAPNRRGAPGLRHSASALVCAHSITRSCGRNGTMIQGTRRA